MIDEALAVLVLYSALVSSDSPIKHLEEPTHDQIAALVFELLPLLSLLFVDLIATRKEFVARHAVFALIVIAADFVAHQAQIEFFLHLHLLPGQRQRARPH